MKGITFDSYHSFDDFKLLLVSKEIGSPNVKVKEIDIPGADGTLDLTDFFGEAKFENLTHKFQFQTTVPQIEFLSLFSNIKNKIHGKKQRIILDDDPSFYYLGRCFVSSFTNEKNIGNISVECECEPYKYKTVKTIISQAVDGESTIPLPNLRKRVVPEVTITADSTIHIVFGTYNVWDLGSGSYSLPELELKAGSNSVSVTGEGTISFEYQEAGL